MNQSIRSAQRPTGIATKDRGQEYKYLLGRRGLGKEEGKGKIPTSISTRKEIGEEKAGNKLTPPRRERNKEKQPLKKSVKATSQREKYQKKAEKNLKEKKEEEHQEGLAPSKEKSKNADNSISKTILELFEQKEKEALRKETGTRTKKAEDGSVRNSPQE